MKRPLPWQKTRNADRSSLAGVEPMVDREQLGRFLNEMSGLITQGELSAREDLRRLAALRQRLDLLPALVVAPETNGNVAAVYETGTKLNINDDGTNGFAGH